MEMYIAAVDIEAGTDCMLIVQVGRGYFLGVWDGINPAKNLGTSSETLSKGRLVQIEGGIISLTEDERIRKVPFTLS